jgi:hypothetical protein
MMSVLSRPVRPVLFALAQRDYCNATGEVEIHRRATWQNAVEIVSWWEVRSGHER